MKRLAMLLLLCVAPVMAQQASETSLGAAGVSSSTSLLGYSYVPTYKDIYCAGFISREHFDDRNHIVGGRLSPEVVHFGLNETVFLAGSHYRVGEKYAIIRDLHDPNRYELYTGQDKDVSQLGHQYAELGHVRILSLENGYAIAKIEASCEPMVPGDVAIPFRDKAEIVVQPRTTPFPVFGVPLPKHFGRIVMSNEFDYMLGTLKPVYINLGSKAGLKPGDYLRVTRTYNPATMPEGDRITLDAPVREDTQRYPLATPKSTMKNWPPKGVGELMVLSVTPNTATCLVTMALEDLKLGDIVTPESER